MFVFRERVNYCNSPKETTMSWKSFFTREKKEDLDKGLEKTQKSFLSKLASSVAGKAKVDEEVLDSLEEILVSSDVSVETTLKIIDKIEERVSRDKYVSTSELNGILKEEIANLLSESNIGESTDFEIPKIDNNPYVIMAISK